MSFPIGIGFWKQDGGGLSYTPPYQISPFAAGYSVARLLNENYSGAAFRARRFGDDVELDIGFNSDGSLDTSALLSFAGINTVGVSVLYDQSGGGADYISPASTSGVPKIVSGGTLNTDANGLPTLRFDGNDYLDQTSAVLALTNNVPHTLSFVVQKITGATSSEYASFSYSVGNNSIASRYALWYNRTTSRISLLGRRDGAGFNELVSSSNYPSNQFLVTSRIDWATTGDGYIYVNNAQVGYASGFVSIGNSSATNSLGADYGRDTSGSRPMVGDITEMLYYSTNQSANLASLNSNLQSYYSIP